jgi:UDP-N-acetylmuramoylalanine--D-glutamate ligase
LELVSEIDGVKFINDSKATNVNATYYALESMKTPTIWIVGGQDKGNDYSEIEELVKRKVKAIVCLGIDNQKIIDHQYINMNYFDSQVAESTNNDQEVPEESS